MTSGRSSSRIINNNSNLIYGFDAVVVLFPISIGCFCALSSFKRFALVPKEYLPSLFNLSSLVQYFNHLRQSLYQLIAQFDVTKHFLLPNEPTLQQAVSAPIVKLKSGQKPHTVSEANVNSSNLMNMLLIVAKTSLRYKKFACILMIEMKSRLIIRTSLMDRIQKFRELHNYITIY